MFSDAVYENATNKTCLKTRQTSTNATVFSLHKRILHTNAKFTMPIAVL